MLASFRDRLRAAVLSLCLLTAFIVPALAGAFEDAVAKFANDDFSDTAEAIEAVAASGNPLAFPIISALNEERKRRKKPEGQADVVTTAQRGGPVPLYRPKE